MSVKKPRSKEQIVIALEREGKAVTLYGQGMSFEEIAYELGYRTRSGAWRAYNRAIARTVLAPAANERDRQIGIVNALLSAWVPKALDGTNAQAVREVNRLMIRLARLTGSDTPINHRMIVTDSMTHEIEQLAARLGVRASETDSPLELTEQVTV